MKYRTERRERLITRTIGGTTHHIPETFTEQVPVMPRDWDTIATRTAAGIVLTLTAVAVTWSTVSIGALLGGGVGYAAAGIFDLSWLTVLLLEWLSRFNQDKRRFPRGAGWLLVLLAAGAIFWHGMLADSVALAVVGAAVSVVSKILWLAVFKHIDRPISKTDAAWLAAEESRLSAQEAVATVRLRAAAAEERAALRLLQAEQIRHQIASLSAPDTSSPDTDATPDTQPVAAPDRASGTVRSAVRAAIATMPDADPDDIAATLAGLGIDVAPDTVRALATPRRKAAVVRLPEPVHQDSPDTDPDGGPSVADTVRRLVREGTTDRDKLLTAVRAVHGQHVSRDTVTRTLRRIEAGGATA